MGVHGSWTLHLGGAPHVLSRRALPSLAQVHKSQGTTLSRAELVLADAFAPGQVYVALSRVVSLAGLWLAGAAVTQAAVKAHPAVIAFYAQAAALFDTGLTLQQYLDKSFYKTATLIAASCRGAAVFSG